MHVLLIEDDLRISSFLIKGLEEASYVVSLCKSAEAVYEGNYLDLPIDLIIVDIMLPGMDGIQFVQTLRYKGNYTPVLMLSALNAVQDKVTALNSGADDYLTKPFHFDELLSRLQALLRRKQFQVKSKPENAQLRFGNLLIDKDQYMVTVSDELIELSPKELKLLLYLVDNKNRTVSRMQILNAVWGITFDNHSNVVDVYISYLRNKIEMGNEKFIFTVKGIGYMFKYEG